MAYKLIPSLDYVTIVPLKPSEVKEYTEKLLSDVETSGMDVLQYGKVVRVPNDRSIEFKEGDIVLYPRLASDKTNFGEPRQILVEVDHIKAHLEETND